MAHLTLHRRRGSCWLIAGVLALFWGAQGLGCPAREPTTPTKEPQPIPRAKTPGRVVQLVSGGTVRFTWAEPGEWLPSPTNLLLRVRWDGKTSRLHHTRGGREHRVNGRVVAVDVTGLRAAAVTRALGAVPRDACALLRAKERLAAPVLKALAKSKRCVQLELTHVVGKELPLLEPIRPYLRSLKVALRADRVSLLSKFQALRHLDLNAALVTGPDGDPTGDCNRKGTMALLRQLTALQSLRLEFSCIDDDHHLKEFPPMPALRRLDSRCDLDPILAKGRELPSLRVLVGTLFNAPRLSTGSQVPRIREHVFSRYLANPSNPRAVALLTQLRILDARPKGFSDDVSPLASLKRLQVLRLGTTAIPGLGRFLAGTPRLSWVSLRDVALDAATVRAIAKLTHLTDLDLWNTGLTDRMATSWSKLQRLRHLELGHNRIGSAWAASLTRLTALRTLGLAGARFTDADLHAILRTPHARRLERLDLEEIPIGDTGLVSLPQLKRLRALNLAFTRITSQSAKSLAGARALQRLSLRGTAVDDAALGHLRRMDRLEWLDLGYTGVTDASIPHMETLPRLHHLNLEDTPVQGGSHPWKLPSIRYLNLARSDLQPSGVANLSQLSRLQILLLTELAVGNQLNALSALRSLRALDLGQTRVTTAVARRLCKLPRLRALALNATLVDVSFLPLSKACLSLKYLMLSGVGIPDDKVMKMYQQHSHLMDDSGNRWQGEVW